MFLTGYEPYFIYSRITPFFLDTGWSGTDEYFETEFLLGSDHGYTF